MITPPLSVQPFSNHSHLENGFRSHGISSVKTLSSYYSDSRTGVIYTPASIATGSAPENIYSIESLNSQATHSAGISESSDKEMPPGLSRSALRSEDKAERQVQAQEQELIKELSARDREVRAHEQAHAAVGGQYAGAPRYEFERGPDGVRYAVGGEVSIDVSKAATPEETVRKAQIVRRAAMAPAEPSAQDRAVAAQATLMEAEAIRELAIERSENSSARSNESVSTGDNESANRENADSADLLPNTSLSQTAQKNASQKENISILSYQAIATMNIESFDGSVDQGANSRLSSIQLFV